MQHLFCFNTDCVLNSQSYYKCNISVGFNTYCVLNSSHIINATSLLHFNTYCVLNSSHIINATSLVAFIIHTGIYYIQVSVKNAKEMLHL